MMDLSNSFCIDWIRVASQLVNLLINVILDLIHEISSLNSTSAHLLSHIKITRLLLLTLQLSKGDLLIWLSDHQILLVIKLLLSRLSRG
jgi:hypothetical protein